MLQADDMARHEIVKRDMDHGYFGAAHGIEDGVTISDSHEAAGVVGVIGRCVF
jgi:hypothetical protein